MRFEGSHQHRPRPHFLKHPVHHTNVEVDVFIEAGAESVNEGDGTDVQACCSTCCATGACCGCACCVVCSCRCCAAAWLRFLCSQGAFFCCIGSGIVDSSGRTTTARGCATPTHWFLINDARTNCSRSRNRKRLSWLIHPKNNICHCHVWPHKHVLISLLPAVDHCRKQQTSYWLFDSLPLAWPPWHKCWQTS